MEKLTQVSHKYIWSKKVNGNSLMFTEKQFEVLTQMLLGKLYSLLQHNHVAMYIFTIFFFSPVVLYFKANIAQVKPEK